MTCREMSRAMNVNISHLILVCSLLATSATTTRPNITTDQFALLALKTQIISDPYGALDNWIVPSPVCKWIGVTYSARHHRVIGLNLSKMSLTGSIPPQIGNLSFLVAIDLNSNNFGGTLPQQLVRLRRLRFLSLRQNNFAGEVPSWFSSFSRLHYLSISNNHFTTLNSFLLSSTNDSKLATLDVSFNLLRGQIPKSLGNLQNLKVLIMNGNKFSGSFPPTIMNTSSLENLSLGENFLQGVLPNDMCLGLPMLKVFNSSYNQISGEIPSNLSSCHHLRTLSLAYNYMISGSIPPEIGSITMLETLFLGGNNLTGGIPTEIGKLENLRKLALENNLLTGSIPVTIFNISFLQILALEGNKLGGILSNNFGNLTELEELTLGSNSFTGVIPQVFIKLTKLKILEMAMNRLGGPLPSFIFNLSAATDISLVQNSLSGDLPTNMVTFLPSLERLYLGRNNLHGLVPNSISNSSLLKVLDLVSNQLTGPIPDSLGKLRFLHTLRLSYNNFSIESSSSELSFVTALASSRYLQVLAINDNPLHGNLPKSIGNLSSSLQSFSASRCNFTGSIPHEIANLSGLVRLYLVGNDLSGMIPSTFNKLWNLQELNLGNNQLTGFIPNDLCKLKNLGSMLLSRNQLTGSLPECLGNVSSLRYIYLYANNLTSGIPASIWSLQDLLEFDISSNSFTGSVSPNIGNMKAIISIDLSMNQLSNDLPNTFGDLQKISVLAMQGNRFQGYIPGSMDRMLSLISLDLSHNMLSGPIPKSLESLTHLEYFNVSFNDLFGEIPTDGPFKNFTSQSFAFNTALCGPSKFQVPPCKESLHKSKKKIPRIAFIFLGVAALMFICTMAILILRHCRTKTSPTLPDISDKIKPQRMSYYELLKATNGFSESNLLGQGSFGSVYKGVREDGTILAIKVFNMLLEVASKTFEAECNALRNLRHRNLIRVVGCFQEFKAMLLEYMPNGSLEKWLYSDDKFLDMMQRLNIMIDVANALEYLHHGYSVPVVHCDLKPSNVILDENMVAQVSDFGITKFLGEQESKTHTRTLATLGYMAPEYGLEGRVSTRCDVYSYGIMLLETFTRKRPSDEMFSEDMNLKNWVRDSLPNALSQVIDASLLSTEEIDMNEKLCCASSVMELALRCSADSPGERINMKDVLAEINKIQAKLMLHHGGTSNMQ